MANLERYKAILFDVGNTLIEQSFNVSKNSPANVLPGVPELLADLSKKFRLGIVSNSKFFSAEDIKQKLCQAGIGNYFEVFISSLDIGAEKPSPIPLQAALDKLKLPSAVTLYVGDNDIDRIAANSSGMDFLFTNSDIRSAFRDFEENPSSAWLRGMQSKIILFDENAEFVAKEIDSLAKPKGSLGRLEDYAILIARITGKSPNIDPAGGAIFVADHGIAFDDSVTPWPQSISAKIAGLIGYGGAAASVLAKNSDVYLEVIDVGTVATTDSPNVRNSKISHGTQDFRNSSAMQEEQLIAALEIGASAAERLVAGGSRILCTGEVGIGNTTSSAILIGRFCDVKAVEVTGRGSGISDEIYKSKLEIVDTQLKKINELDDPLEILAKVGGLEIAALVGFITRGATLRVPILLDGVTTLAAALVAKSLKPEVSSLFILGHLSAEPASQIAAKHLSLRPILDLNLRLGEGTGAILAIPILRAACRVVAEMSRLSDLD
jgi:nicotinate-nucleotide--dimethylbenzimidazole phosphoribosyltransferase